MNNNQKCKVHSVGCKEGLPLFSAGCIGQWDLFVSQSLGTWSAPPECSQGSQGAALVFGRKQVPKRLVSYILAFLFQSDPCKILPLWQQLLDLLFSLEDKEKLPDLLVVGTGGTVPSESVSAWVMPGSPGLGNVKTHHLWWVVGGVL